MRKMNISLLITSSKYEYNSIFRFNYGYNRNNVILTGLSRFDNLLDLKNKIKKKKNYIIISNLENVYKGD